MQTNKITNLRRNIIINFLLLTILLITSKISAQNDTIFFDQNWKECSKKTALYYRIGPTKEIVPRCAFGPRKNQSYYTIKDYYINNNTLQFSGKSKDKNGKHLFGEAKWFNEDGSLQHLKITVLKTTKQTSKFQNGQFYTWIIRLQQKVNLQLGSNFAWTAKMTTNSF